MSLTQPGGRGLRVRDNVTKIDYFFDSSLTKVVQCFTLPGDIVQYLILTFRKFTYIRINVLLLYADRPAKDCHF